MVLSTEGGEVNKFTTYLSIGIFSLILGIAYLFDPIVNGAGHIPSTQVLGVVYLVVGLASGTYAILKYGDEESEG